MSQRSNGTESTSQIALLPHDGEVVRDALISPCGLYRYDLSRRWSPGVGRVAFIGLNPSTADGLVDDPTIRRCIRFARDWGYGAMRMVNLFAYRTPDPRDLVDTAEAGIDPVGVGNDEILRRLGETCSLVVAAWGAHPLAEHRALQVAHLLPPLVALGVTKGGQPRHPLYMRADSRPVCWAPEVSNAA